MPRIRNWTLGKFHRLKRTEEALWKNTSGPDKEHRVMWYALPTARGELRACIHTAQYHALRWPEFARNTPARDWLRSVLWTARLKLAHQLTRPNRDNLSERAFAFGWALQALGDHWRQKRVHRLDITFPEPSPSYEQVRKLMKNLTERAIRSQNLEIAFLISTRWNFKNKSFERIHVHALVWDRQAKANGSYSKRITALRKILKAHPAIGRHGLKLIENFGGWCRYLARNYDETARAQVLSKKHEGCPVPHRKKPSYQPAQITAGKRWTKLVAKSMKIVSAENTAWRKAVQLHALAEELSENSKLDRMAIHDEKEAIRKKLQLPEIPAVWVRGQDGHEYDVAAYDRDTAGNELYALHRRYSVKDLRQQKIRRKLRDYHGEMHIVPLEDLWRLGGLCIAPHAFTPQVGLDPVTGKPARPIHARLPSEITLRYMDERARRRPRLKPRSGT
jgi:hypothetical protein